MSNFLKVSALFLAFISFSYGQTSFKISAENSEVGFTQTDPNGEIINQKNSLYNLDENKVIG
ncbi:MAG: hypothetical protein D8M58_19755 [Calditrichaeota bacterium]|nr:MAG: hypothetical protein DWQ03_14500 [Calditrichota bacterium]MBL1207645.1 hypothetical protein [Calditrichota bacterium]NOG47478.1 hypothetical protein [Calditrichota bacterium]